MQRSHVYLAGSSLVVVSGLIAIAQAQRGGTTSKPVEVEAAVTAPAERATRTPRPIALVPETTSRAKFADAKTETVDPFQAAGRAADRLAAAVKETAARGNEDGKPSAFPAAAAAAAKPWAAQARDEMPAAGALADAENNTTNERSPAVDPFGLRNKAGAAAADVRTAVKTVAAEAAETEPAPPGASNPWGGFSAGEKTPVTGANAKADVSARAGASAAVSNPIKAGQKPADPFGDGMPTGQSSKYPSRPSALAGDAQDARAMPQAGATGPQDGFGAVPRDVRGVPESSSRLPTEGAGRPGNKQTEGQQSAQVTLEKTAPREIQVGKPATFEIKVRNVGNVAAQGVELHDDIPKGTQLINTTPRASRGPRGDLMWVLGAIKPGEETLVKIELMPTAEGEIGSVATVKFDTEASVRTISTKPELAVQVSAPRQVMIGDDLTITITVSNPGTGAATGVILEERVPTGLQHAAGVPELEFEIGELKPGQSRQLDLTMKAMQAGQLVNVLCARGDANLRVEERSDIEIVAPALKVALNGPSRRFLDRPASYTVSVSNPGTAPAKNVELVTYLPKGLKFVKADNSGYYDSQKHRVVWSLAELPPAEKGEVKLTALPIEEGEQKMRIEGKAMQGLSDMEEQTVVVEGVAAIMFEITDVEDPVEAGGEAIYEIRVINQGSRSANNIRVMATLPAEMKALGGEGPTRFALDDKRVVFDPLSRLAPKTDATFRVRAQVLRPGDLRVKAQVITDEVQSPVTKEESTRVYQDE